MRPGAWSEPSRMSLKSLMARVVMREMSGEQAEAT